MGQIVKNAFEGIEEKDVRRLMRAAFATVKGGAYSLTEWEKGMFDEHRLVLIEVLGDTHTPKEMLNYLAFIWGEDYKDIQTGYTLKLYQWAMLFNLSKGNDIYDRLKHAGAMKKQIEELDRLTTTRPCKEDIRYRRMKLLLGGAAIIVVLFLGMMNLVSHRYHYYSHSGLTTVYDRWTGEKEVVNMFDIYRHDRGYD